VPGFVPDVVSLVVENEDAVRVREALNE